MQQQELLRSGHVARVLGVNEKTLWAWYRMEDNEPGTGLRYVRLPGGERRVRTADLERILGHPLG